jgi:hypothetical protein
MRTTGVRLIRIGILVFVAVIAAIVLVVTGTTHRRLLDRVDYLVANCTDVTTGVVYTNAKKGLLFFSQNTVGAEFTLNGKNYQAGGIDDSKHDRGDTITVHYNPNRPAESYSGVAPSVFNVKIFILIYVVCGLLIMGAGAALIYYAISDK